MNNQFLDREDAGRRLAAELRSYATAHPIVLALPRGGVPVGYEIARALDAPLDVWVVRKVGVPWQPELGVGAVAEGGYLHLNDEILGSIALSEADLGEAIRIKRCEVEERVRKYRGDHPPPRLLGRTVILVDDGIATGGTVRAALDSIRAQGPRAIVLAVPVAALQTILVIEPEVERVVCLETPADLRAIGLWYADFHQLSDDEVARLLDDARRVHEGAEHAIR